MRTKYIIVAGGVISGVGKGVATASLAKILKDYGYKTTCMKIDPYINVDAGTMNPTEHGEVFVTEDGDETDQDIGNYERFLNENVNSVNYMTTGRVYLSVIERERRLEYGGKCVEVVPHIPFEVIDRFKKVAEATKAEIVVVEVGGTVGEYQNILFLEAARMLHLKNPEDMLFVLVSYLPVPKNIGEMKTKPTQYAAMSMNSAGIQPDFIVCRAELPIDNVRKQKIATFCNIQPEHVISAPDVDTIYDVPEYLEKEGFGKKILKKFGLEPRKNDLPQWEKRVHAIKNCTDEVKIGIVGKYFDHGDYMLSDSYLSVIEAVKHASWALNVKPVISWIDAEQVDNVSLQQYHGIIVPGGFGARGVEGKIKAIQFCREHDVPYLGICYGMQLAVVEFARNACGMNDAHTTEVNKETKHPVIDIQTSQRGVMAQQKYGGTMRLGAYAALLKNDTQVYDLYKRCGRVEGDNEQIAKNNIEQFRLGVMKGNVVLERHRHRYEVNPIFVEQLEQNGMIFSGYHERSDGTKLMEFIELNGKHFYGTQAHPEFKSRVENPAPLFVGFMEGAKKRKQLGVRAAVENN
ncbi:MAG TPA: CTP synthase [Candidatus Nanoarchaeia archaeon]|nr:CTP synthase [Candidatus Nanoarchaeia archaeon]